MDKNKKFSMLWIIIPLSVIVIGFLFYIPFWINSAYLKGGNFQTVWNGSEFLAFYGSALGAIGTVSLGAITIWQNYRFKKTNEEAQDRLERLTYRANEISIINKIIEYENNRISNMTRFCDEFIKSCAGSQLSDAAIENKNIRSVASHLLGEAGRNYLNLSRTILIDKTLTKESPIVKALLDLYTLNYNICNAILTKGTIEAIKVEEVRNLNSLLENFRMLFEAYTILCQTRIRKVIFETITLEETRKLFGYKQEAENGQDEDGE